MNRRFFCDEIPDIGQSVRLSTAESRHLRQVLRGGNGEEITLFDGKGGTAMARVAPVCGESSRNVDCVIVATQHAARAQLLFTLFIAPPRHKGMVQIVRQAVELGVNEIVPVITGYSVATPGRSAVATWETAAREAGKQSGNPCLPTIQPPRAFADAVHLSNAPGFIGCPATITNDDGASSVNQEAEDIIAVMRQLGTRRVDLWVGPEGGFTGEETGALVQIGIVPLTVGSFTLRVETAAVACIAWIHGAYGHDVAIPTTPVTP